MATAAVLTERAESLGLPITKNAFEGTLENPVPPLPYMVYLLPREATAGADSRPNNLMADDWQLELYTVADDEAAEEIRTRIENEVLHDVDYVKFVAYVESEEIRIDKESIVLGSGDLYCTDFQGTNEAIPDDAVIETEDNRLGHIKGGAEIEYAPEFYEAKDDMGKVSKVIITEEEATLKSGIMTWCGTTLEKLCQTARVTEDKTKGIRTVKIGGIGNATGKKYLLRFVHKDTQDGNIRVTIVGNNQAGFTIAFAKDSETVIDAEFKAQPMDKEGTLILYTEDIDKTE